MKKLLYLLLLIPVLFTACGDDDDYVPKSGQGEEPEEVQKEVLIAAMKSTTENGFTYSTSYEYDDNNQLTAFYSQKIHSTDDPDAYKTKYTVGERVGDILIVTEYQYDLTSKDWVKGYITYKLHYNNNDKIELAERFISNTNRDIAFSIKWDGDKIIETAGVAGSINFDTKMEYDADGNFIYLGSKESSWISNDYEDDDLGIINRRLTLKQKYESSFTSDKNYYSLLPIEAVVVQHLKLRESIPFSHYCSTNAINTLNISYIQNSYIINSNEEEPLSDNEYIIVTSYTPQLGSQSSVYPAKITITDQKDNKFVNYKKPDQNMTSSATEVETIDITYIEKK